MNRIGAFVASNMQREPGQCKIILLLIIYIYIHVFIYLFDYVFIDLFIHVYLLIYLFIYLINLIHAFLCKYWPNWTLAGCL